MHSTLRLDRPRDTGQSDKFEDAVSVVYRTLDSESISWLSAYKPAWLTRGLVAGVTFWVC